MNKYVKGQYLRDLSALTQACSTFKMEVINSNSYDIQGVLETLLGNYEDLKDNPLADYLILSLRAGSSFLCSRKDLEVLHKK